MFRRRLRPKYTDEQLKQVYRTPHNSNNWADHKVRVRQTISLGKEASMPDRFGTIADLSCGNAMIAKKLAEHFKADAFLGDFAPGYVYTGPIEKTIDQLGPNVNLFICSETIEHLDDPDAVLRQIRGRAAQLLLSTPIGEDNDGNPEHYWGWDKEAVSMMLIKAGWDPRLCLDLHFTNPGFPYDYQIWLCQ